MSEARLSRSELVQIFLVIALAIIVSLPSLANGFAYDDIPIIVENQMVQSLSAPWEYLKEPYWPNGADVVYRPLTIWLFALQWRLGSGTPLIFHAANLLLFLGSVLLTYRLARFALPAPWAALAAAAFAVHPVHVEAVANVVGQAELNVAASTLLAVVIFLDGRLKGSLGRRRVLVLAGLTIWAGLAKEQGLMIPAFLLAAELIVASRQPDGMGQRLRSLVPVFALQCAAGLLLLVLRLGAVPLSGGMQAEAIRGYSVLGRGLTMLAVVPEWLRLLFWPIRLQAEYGPGEISAATGWGLGQTAGLFILLAAVTAAVRLRARRPAISFGVVWILLGLFPVSNVLKPTGIVLAERTLYLPSVGAVLVAAAALAWLWSFIPRTVGRPVVIGTLSLVLAVASWLTASRQRVWRDNDTLLSATVVDAPRSYRAWWLYANHLAMTGDTISATKAYATAAELSAGDSRFWEEYGQHVRLAEGCPQAIPLFERGLEISDSSVPSRTRLYYCLLEIGDPARAEALAREGAAMGVSAFIPLVRRANSLIDSAGTEP